MRQDAKVLALDSLHKGGHLFTEIGNIRKGAILGGDDWTRIGRAAFAVSVEVSRKELALWGLEFLGKLWARDLAYSWRRNG